VSTERIRLHRAVAVIRPDSIAIRPARGGLVAPLVQGLLAAGAVWLIVAFINVLPIWALMGLLLFAIVFGPIAVLGFVYNLAGTSFLMERQKHSARWQQGFLGLGLGTHALVPFQRIARIEAHSDAAEELSSGDLQDVVQWQVRLVKDNGRVLTVGTVAAARPFAPEGAERANALAAALASMAGVEASLAPMPAEPSPEASPTAARPSRRYRRID
jgi:ABC-type transport system involved in cytochrome bd biosynthesis fused ATPase/permease subunit